MRKRFLSILAAVVGVALFAGCGADVLSGKPGSSGKTLELMVVAKNSVYSGHTKLLADSLFASPQVGLNQPEPRFDVVQIAPSSFEGNTMFQAHRNILMLEVDPQQADKVYLEYNKWSSPQVVIRIAARSTQSLDSLLLTNGERLLKEFYNKEYARMEKVFSQTPNIKVNKALQQKYGFTLMFPEEFTLAKSEDSFMWVRKEAKDFSLGVYVSVAPAGERSYEEAYILDNLDTLMKRYVPGPAEGSYQGTERRDFFYTREATIGDTKAVETRGLWRLYGDFMSGPFVCYTFPSADGTQTVTLVGYVYSPSQRNKMVMKRDLLMQVDGICHSYKANQQ